MNGAARRVAGAASRLLAGSERAVVPRCCFGSGGDSTSGVGGAAEDAKDAREGPVRGGLQDELDRSEERSKVLIDACGPIDDEEEDEMEDMFVDGPAGTEWGGPTRGGRLAEPTRYGDWERKGRCTDF